MKSLLKALCCAEDMHAGGVTAVIEEHLSSCVDELKKDALGNLFALRRCPNADAPTLMLEAHMDEIGFVVTHVDDDGFVHVASCGGIDRRVLAATEVTILTDPILHGVFCSTPPHLSDSNNTVKSLDEMGIDIGLSSEIAKNKVPVGTKVVFRSHFEELGSTIVCSKALDDRAGCAAVIRAMSMLSDEPLSCNVMALFAVQEEIGGAGALTGAYSVFPDAAIVTDVSFAHTPDASRYECGLLGQGAMLGIAPGLDAVLTSTIRDVANHHSIAIQTEVMGGSTGTDADHIVSAKNGIPTALLSIPQRYMHTPIETVDVRDVLSVSDLMVHTAKEFKGL